MDLDNKKDPRGLVENDLVHLRSLFKPIVVTPKTTMAEIQFSAGEQKVLDYIANKMIAGHRL